MNYELILGVIVLVITFMLLVLRTNSAVVFFSLCAGSVLATQLGNEATLLSSTVIKDGDLNKSIVYIALIILPVLFSAIFLRGSVSSGKLLLNIIPSIATGGLLLIFIIPLLPASVTSQILASSAWSKLLQFQPLILIIGVVSSIIMLFFTHSRRNNKKHKKH